MTKSRIIVSAIVIGFVLVSAVVFGVLWSTNRLPNIDIGTTPDDKTFNVGIGNKIYEDNVTGFVFGNGENFTVTTPSEDFSVIVITKRAKEDFYFLVAEAQLLWSSTIGTDFTSGFSIKQENNTFTVTYTNLATVIGRVLKYDYGAVKVPAVPTGDLFEMRITSGEKTITIGFTLAELGGNMGVIDIELDTDHIIFGETNA